MIIFETNSYKKLNVCATLFSVIMSVDVFGRQLDRSKGKRGPPGVGYKLTADGNFDLENKRLSNVADAKESYDAINLNMLHRLIETINELKQKLETLDEIVEGHRDDIDAKFFNLETVIQNLQNGTPRTS